MQQRKRIIAQLEASIRTTHNLTLALLALDDQVKADSFERLKAGQPADMEASSRPNQENAEMPGTPSNGGNWGSSKPGKKIRRGRGKNRDAQAQ